MRTAMDATHVFIYEGPGDDKLVLKAYLSPDGKRLRIVLPELAGYAQIKHFVDGPVKFLEFAREPPKGSLRIK